MDIQKTLSLISVPSDGSIREALKALDQGAIGLAVLTVPGSNKFDGLVTDGDIRRALLSGLGLETPVRDIKRPQPKTAKAGMSMEQISLLFSDPVRVVPVLNDDGEVVDLAVFDKRVHLPVAEPSFGEKELSYVNECVLTGWVSSAGKYVTRFEKMFAEYCNVKYAVSTSNGTTALHLALLAGGIGPGDEAIVPSLTFIATANAVTYTGAKPVFVDSEETTWNIDPEKIEASITKRTKAIIPVHIYGHPADMDPIIEIARKYNLQVIEDAAEALGAKYKGKIVGGIGGVGVFSFFGNKIITTGEGGMVVTNDEDLADRIRMLRDHGMDVKRRYWHPVLGFNYRLTNIQAALGVAQMEKVDSIVSKKRFIASQYKKSLSGIDGLGCSPEQSWAQSVYWMFSILVDKKILGIGRDEMMDKLKEYDVETRPFFPPVHTQPIYNSGITLPVSESLSSKGINLPSYVNIQENDISRVCNIIKDICGTTA